MNISNLKKTYGGRTVLDIGEYDFEPEKVYAVIGANGSGKSTLARLISGAVEPDSGRVVGTFGLRIGYMPQKSYAFRMSTLKNVMLSARGDQGRENAMELLSELHIDNLAGAKAHRLSGGETARMAMARLMMKRCDLLILDEPTAAMDVQSTLIAEDMILRYRDECGCAVILVTHSLKQAKRLGDYALFLHEGRLEETGACKKVLTSPENPLTLQFLEMYDL